MTVYRLTVRTADGARYISDYREHYMAESIKNKLLNRPDAIAYNWREGEVLASIVLNSLTGITIEKLEIPDAEGCEGKECNQIAHSGGPKLYLGTIHIVEAV
jgi:hypothetical protein